MGEFLCSVDGFHCCEFEILTRAVFNNQPSKCKTNTANG